MSHSDVVVGPEGDHFVTLEQYGLPPSSSQQKLTPLDMNMPRLYGARWILCFPLPLGADKGRVYENLREGLSQTIQSIPWIAGKIGPEEGQDPKHNRIQVVDSSSGVKFRFQDLTGILPSYTELTNERFPLSRLSTAQLGPMGAMPDGPEQPVMAAQANFIEGGLLLAVGVHHSVCDASALDAIVNTWSQNTAAASGSSIPFTTYDTPSNDRSPLMEGMPGANLAEFPEYMLPSPVSVSTQQMSAMAFEMPPLAARIFRFSPESLATLKATAAAFSTHDALCAFIWQRMTLARRRSGVFADPSSDGDTSALAFAINIRNRTSPPLPPTYLGNASMASMTKRLAVSILTSDNGLSQAATAIRKSLGAFSTPSRVPLTIGLLGSRPDATDFKLAYHAFLGPDIVATSWADLKVYESDWGGLGSVNCLRVPGEGADGVIVILPRLKDGGLDVSISLALGAMEKLLEDEEFTKVAEP